jgi:hypothetical protein
MRPVATSEEADKPNWFFVIAVGSPWPPLSRRPGGLAGVRLGSLPLPKIVSQEDQAAFVAKARVACGTILAERRSKGDPTSIEQWRRLQATSMFRAAPSPGSTAHEVRRDGTRARLTYQRRATPSRRPAATPRRARR